MRIWRFKNWTHVCEACKSKFFNGYEKDQLTLHKSIGNIQPKP